MTSEAVCKRTHDQMFRGRKLLPINQNIYEKYFEGADEHRYYTREEFGDGSCFFHSLATLLNLHGDTPDGDHPTQSTVLENIRQRIATSCEHTDVTACFNFVEGDYEKITENQRKKLGHRLRQFVRDAVDTRWDGFWSEKTKNQAHLLNRVYEKGEVKRMLQDTSIWADVYVILFVMHVLNLNIMFFDESKEMIYCGVQGERMKQQPTVFIMWVKNSHFQPVLRLTCDTNGKHRVKGLFHHQHDNVVRHIFHKWENQQFCPRVKLKDVLL